MLVDNTLKNSHGQIITLNIKVKKKRVLRICSEFVIFLRMAIDDKTGLLAEPSAAQN
jgi:hypothetical protein